MANRKYDHQQVISLYHQGKSYKEISALTGVCGTTLSVIIQSQRIVLDHVAPDIHGWLSSLSPADIEARLRSAFADEIQAFAGHDPYVALTRQKFGIAKSRVVAPEPEPKPKPEPKLPYSQIEGIQTAQDDEVYTFDVCYFRNNSLVLRKPFRCFMDENLLRSIVMSEKIEFTDAQVWLSGNLLWGWDK